MSSLRALLATPTTQIDLILPEDRDDYIARVSALLEDVGEACIEHRLRRKDGSFVYVLCYGRQYYNPVLLRMVGVRLPLFALLIIYCLAGHPKNEAYPEPL